MGRRYTDRAYDVADVRVYSNADSVQLVVNGRPIEKLVQAQSVLKTFEFKNVKLRQGANVIAAVGDHNGKRVTDTVRWSLNTRDINIAAGQLTTGFKSSSGERFGSDNFFIGGDGDWLVEKGTQGVKDRTDVCGTTSPDLFKNFRKGRFSYDIPLSDGRYEVTLGFLEPDRDTKVGDRIFDVLANGEKRLADLDVLSVAGSYRNAIRRTFSLNVSGGHLKLDFVPSVGVAVVSNIMIRKQNSAARKQTKTTPKQQKSAEKRRNTTEVCPSSPDPRCASCPVEVPNVGYGR
jgi:beta-galactosidase